MYPIKFEDIFILKPWGGRKLEQYKKNLPEGIIGEVWDVSGHPEGTSIVANGKFKGISLTDLIEQEGEKVIGMGISTNWFPLMIRYVSANEKLSIQVHPDHEYAHIKQQPMGKSEAWYILDAPPGAYLYAGVTNCSEESFRKAIENNDVEKYMKKLYVSKGDVVFIPSGLVHAICEGLTLIEVCCNSNTTYRIYDYNRGRGLDLEEAFEVIKFEKDGFATKGLQVKKAGFSKTYLSLDKDFSLELYDVSESFSERSDRNRFYIFTCIEGDGIIQYNLGTETIQRGESVLIPAFLGDYKFEGKLKMLKSYVPDISQVEKEVLQVIGIY
jgi:mannose-6-phosphate isomerase